MEEKPSSSPSESATAQSAAPAEPSVKALLADLVKRAQAGDPTVLPLMREILDAHPEVWQHVGDLSSVAERAWIALLAAENPLAVESMKRTVAEMRLDLGGEHPTRMERMLVDQVIMCWMEVKYLETATASAEGSSLAQASFRLKHVESAQKRYLTSIKMMTEVRTLIPAGLAPSVPLKLYDPEPKHRKQA